jgi:hypothetical protein
MPRGLSIDKDGLVVMGFRTPEKLAIFNVDDVSNVEYIPCPCEPCCIGKLDYDNDFSNNNSSLVHPYVLQCKLDCLGLKRANEFIMGLKNIIENTFDVDWSYYNNKRTQQENRNPFTTMLEGQASLDDVINPPSYIFDNIRNFQSVVKNKIHMTQLDLQDGANVTVFDHFRNREKYHNIQAYYDMIEKIVTEVGCSVTGKLFLYPPQSAMGWHTNIEVPMNSRTFRCYVVCCSKDNASFFMYRHPISGKFHAVPDRNMYCNIFYLGNKYSPFWHSIINPSLDVERLSFGIAFIMDQCDTLQISRDNLKTILHHKKKS